MRWQLFDEVARSPYNFFFDPADDASFIVAPPPFDIDELMKLPAESFGTPHDWVPFIGLGRLCEEDIENVGGEQMDFCPVDD